MRYFKVFVLLLLLALLGVFAVLSAEPTHELSGWFITIAAILFFFTRNKQSSFLRFLFLLTVSFVSLRYIAFRSMYTLEFESKVALALALVLFVAELYSILVHFIGIAVNIYPLNRKKAPLPKKLPSVDIFIPTYNEDEEIALITATACKNLDYPQDLLNIYILNDGGRLSMLNNPKQREKAYQRHLSLKEKAEKIGVFYLTRENGDKAKAGMINEALMGRAFSTVKQNKDGVFVGGKPQKTSGELILILDCDHVPTTDFLKETVGYFAQNDKLFMVQTPHFMINQDPIRKNLDYNKTIPAEGFLFYHFVQRGLDRWNASFFCGSAAVLRRRILEENGGLEGDTITEDCETALNLHAKGYDSAFVDKPLIAGLETENFESFIGQRSRWCKGMLQILLLKKPLFAKGLSFMQRLSYLNSCLFWLFPLFRYVFVLAPLVFLYFSINIYNATFMQVVNYAGPHIICSVMVMYYLYPKARGFLYSEVLETVQMVCLLPATLSVFLHPRKPTFNITPKGLVEGNNYTSLRIIPFLILLALILGGFGRAVYIYLDYPLLLDAVLLTGFWNLFNLFVIVVCLGVMWEKKQEYKNFSVPLKDDDFVEIDTHQAKLKRLCISEMEFDLPKKVSLEENKVYDVVMPNGSKTEVKIEKVKKSRVLASMTNQLSQDNIRFVFGDSSRWQSVYTTYTERKSKLPVGLYIIGSSLKNCYSIAKDYFKFAILLAFLLLPNLAHAEESKISLSQIKGHAYTYFNNVSGSSSLAFYVSSRWKISDAKLVVYYQKTPSLQEKDFALKFSLRKNLLSFQKKDGVFEVDLPPEILKNGENEILITFSSPQKTEDCTLGERVLAVDLKKSYLLFNYDVLPPENKNDIKLSNLFNARDLDPVKINLVYENLDLRSLKDALLIASKSAIEATSRPLELTFKSFVLPDKDNIFLDGAAPIDLSKNISVFRASQISGAPVFKQNVLEQGRTYALSDLGFNDKMFKRSKDQKSFRFLVPSVSYLSPNKYISMNLDLVLGNHIKPGSKLKILINGKNIAEVILRNVKGQEIKEYQVKFRASLLRKGINTISFMADMAANDSQVDCFSAVNEGIFITLFNNSTIEIPELGTLIELPNLKFLFNDGYPFNGQTDIFLSELSEDSAEAVLNIGAYLAQKRGTLPQAAEFYIGKPDYKGRNIISFETDRLLNNHVLVVSQEWIGDSDNLKMTYKARSFKVMKEALNDLWNTNLFENIDGDTLEFDTKNKTLRAYNTSSHKEISSDVGVQNQLSSLSNNNILWFYLLLSVVLLSTSGWLLLLLKGTKNEKE